MAHSSKQGSAVSPAITRRDPRVYVEVSCSFSLWAPDQDNPRKEETSPMLALALTWSHAVPYEGLKEQAVGLESEEKERDLDYERYLSKPLTTTCLCMF